MYQHVKAAENYVARVISGEIIACKWVILACKRHLADLKKSESVDFSYRFDPEKADRVCRFAEKLPHAKGKWAKKNPLTGRNQTMRLEPWQQFTLGCIFGWVKKSNSKRRFRKASLYIPRKNGKSFFAAIIGWYMGFLDGEPGAEIYSGATSEKQAWEVFGPARQMGIIEPLLPSGLGVAINAQSIVRASDNSKFLPIIGRPGDGASPHCAIIDEYHEHPTSDLYDTMMTGMGAREQPLALVISTAGSNLAGPCREDWKACERLLEGGEGFDDETHFAIIWSIDEADDWDTELALIKANPNWGVSIMPDGILAELKVAARDARKQAAYKTKYLNMWVSAKDGFYNVAEWNALAKPGIKPEDYKEFPCYLAGDLASKHDLTALMQLFCLPGGRYALFGKYYLPEATMEKPENQHYRTWRIGGWITQTDGEITDLQIFSDDVEDICANHNVLEMPSDPNRAWGVFPALAKKGVPIVEYRNTVLTMSEPMKELDALIRAGLIEHNGDPVLAWAISNVTGKIDKKDNVYPNKESPANKIDPVVATLFALGRAMTREPEHEGSFFSF